MANTIITKNSSTASAVPTSGDLVQGELAVNVTDKRLFTEDSGGNVVEVGTNPSTMAVAGNATVGGTLGVTGVATLTANPVLSAGTANGVAFLNASKVLTSGSALTFDGTSMTFADNSKAIFGAGSDLQIYHDGTNSYISDQGTGNLYIQGSSYIQLQDADGNVFISCVDDGTGGRVQLRNEGSTKLATTNTGIDVTGTVVTDGLQVDGGTANGVTYLNGSKVLTSGSALTFDGTEFKVNAASGNVLVQPSNVANAKLYMRHGSIANNNGFEVDSSSSTIFLQAGTEAMRLTSTGLGIGTSSPSDILHIQKRVTGAYTGGVIDGGLRIDSGLGAADGGYAHNGITFYGDADNASFIYQIHNNSDSSQLVIGTNNTERARIDSSGHLIVPAGVTLGTSTGTYNAANTLDDYEEGTFTPIVEGTTTTGTGTYTSQEGYYTKVGNLVTFKVRIIWTAHTGTGNMRFAGMPFTAGSYGYHAVSIQASDLSLDAGEYLTALFNSSTNAISPYNNPTGGGAVSIVSMDSAGSVTITGQYRV